MPVLTPEVQERSPLPAPRPTPLQVLNLLPERLLESQAQDAALACWKYQRGEAPLKAQFGALGVIPNATQPEVLDVHGSYRTAYTAARFLCAYKLVPFTVDGETRYTGYVTGSQSWPQ